MPKFNSNKTFILKKIHMQVPVRNFWRDLITEFYLYVALFTHTGWLIQSNLNCVLYKLNVFH